MDNIDVDYARSKGIAVVNTPAASSNSVAELVFAHLLSTIRFLNKTNRQMADMLSLSVRTVESHRSNLMGKLDLHSRVELVRYARENNLIN